MDIKKYMTKEDATLCPDNIVYVEPASKKAAKMVVKADEETGDGRSEWFWMRMPSGDLLLCTYPQGETYEATEWDRTG